MMHRAGVLPLIGLLVLALANLEAEELTSTEQPSLSPAETLLWLTDHLAHIDKPSKLHYQFTRRGSLEEDFDDRVDLYILNVNADGTKEAKLDFFSGDRNQFVPPQENVRGNPVLGIYLQGDVYEMDRLTGGNWRYFHRRLKYGFADGAEVTPITFNYNGHMVEGEQIRISPYVNDPKRPQFEQFADKEYVILLSEEVPGSLYQIHTVIPGKKEDGAEMNEPLIEETLTFVDITAIQ
ncbi:MAG: hypothetical protein L0Z68_07660 [Gammaproteobacteria bacterium]|nr:hypothetical protein [Gammaproteobacteria bacterium]